MVGGNEIWGFWLWGSALVSGDVPILIRAIGGDKFV